METLIFSTPIGSRLHGLHNADSDHDMWHVHTQLDTRKVVHNVDDQYHVGLSTFLRHAENGYYVALDAIFSPVATSSWFDDYRHSFHVSVSNMRDNYRNCIIKKLIPSSRTKHHRHALRMALNYREAYEGNGRFNPCLSAEYAAMCHEFSSSNQFLDKLNQLWPHDDLFE